MERSTWETSLTQRVESDRLRDRGGVQDHAAARDAPVFRRDGDFLDRLVELWIPHAHDHHVRAGGINRNISSRRSDPRRALAVHPDDVDP
jgi:hypothetical protein